MTSSSESSQPSWRSLNADTDEWAEQLQFKFYREAPAWKKLEMASELTRGMLLLAQAGLESRHPEASAAEIRRLMADIRLGEDLALRVYGPKSK